uniref:Uncharacterized protein n=1 Tax=Acidithiobacillus ferrianus TaxID=2678518 RepID=A0A845U6Z2_9PROT|nr:hypothetical protein [Acidithiobacillus ferrianus]
MGLFPNLSNKGKRDTRGRAIEERIEARTTRRLSGKTRPGGD